MTTLPFTQMIHVFSGYKDLTYEHDIHVHVLYMYMRNSGVYLYCHEVDYNLHWILTIAIRLNKNGIHCIVCVFLMENSLLLVKRMSGLVRMCL